jgi:Fe-S oxidoreductase
MPDPTTGFLSACSSCTQCQTVCPFLDTYGPPDDIIANRSQLAFLCTNCTACDKRCPLELSPSDAMFATKQRLITEGKVPEKAAKAIKGASSFARRGHSSPFVRYDAGKTAFWPGCSLAGTSPEVTIKIPSLLESVLGEKTGLVLDCCFDPLWQMGNTKPVADACGRIRARLRVAGIEHLIVGCVNCRKVFGKYMPEVDVTYIVDALPGDILATLPGEEDLYLHHPCPAYHVDGVIGRTRDLLGNKLKGEVDEHKIPGCCGYGGSVNTQDADLALKFTERVTMAAYGASIVTSCMGCKNMFLKKGTPTYHILELITGVKPKAKAVGAARKWSNRLILAKSRD